MSIFRKLMPRKGKFLDMFSARSKTVVGAAQAFSQLPLGNDVHGSCGRIVKQQNDSNKMTRHVHN